MHLIETSDAPAVARRAVGPLSNNIPEGAQVEGAPGLVGQRLRTNPRSAPRVNFANFPHARRHPQSASL